MTYMYPAYLAGTLGVAIREDLGLDRAALGLTISLFFAIGATAMTFGGRVADRMGPRRALRIAAGMTGACLVGVAVFGGSWAGLLVSLAIGGIGSAVGAPVGALLILRHVAPSRRPIAFGLERSSLPASTLLASISLPLLATVLHWRLVFLVGALAVIVLVALRIPDAAPRAAKPVSERAEDTSAPAPRGRLAPVGPLLLITLAFFLGSASATALSSFFVDYGVLLGFSQSEAGVALAFGSVVIIAARFGLGLGRVRRPGRLTVAAMMALGAAGFLLLMSGDRVLAVIGMCVACGAGWGWTGLVALALAEVYREAPGAASGLVQAGGSAGGILGPLLVGATAKYYSYPVGWSLSAIFLALASVMVLANRALWKERR
ncbi:nitrate/nitrite transporter [Microbispora sp. H11081]|uniref:MFS transporter n=1 Tax=Microbispora sp. H11081 TaxID=2729107 RepID=UPI0014763A94|nr:MFS transporter [Microbispora sp. H11081]